MHDEHIHVHGMCKSRFRCSRFLVSFASAMTLILAYTRNGILPLNDVGRLNIRPKILNKAINVLKEMRLITESRNGNITYIKLTEKGFKYASRLAEILNIERIEKIIDIKRIEVIHLTYLPDLIESNPAKAM